MYSLITMHTILECIASNENITRMGVSKLTGYTYTVVTKYVGKAVRMGMVSETQLVKGIALNATIKPTIDELRMAMRDDLPKSVTSQGGILYTVCAKDFILTKEQSDILKSIASSFQASNYALDMYRGGKLREMVH